MITIKEAKTKAEMKQFVLFPFDLFKENPYWIPPIISDEMDTFDAAKNPFLKQVTSRFLLAYRNNKIVGRVVAIINWEEVNTLNKNKTRFGWFDAIDDIEVTKALLEEVSRFGRENKMENIEGPLGFSNLDKVGVLTEGFDQMGTIVSWYSLQYYSQHFEKLGYVKEKKFIESLFSFNKVPSDMYTRGSRIIQTKYKLTLLNFTKTKQLLPYIDQMFEVFNSTYSKLPSFVTVTPEQITHVKNKHISFINPEYIKFVMDENGKMVAFCIVMPNFAEAQKQINGKLFPFGFIKMLQAKKNSKEVVFYLIGIMEEYRSKGVTAILFDEYHKVFTAKGIKTCVRTAELEENLPIHNLFKNFDPVIHKKRCTYIKEL